MMPSYSISEPFTLPFLFRSSAPKIHCVSSFLIAYCFVSRDWPLLLYNVGHCTLAIHRDTYLYYKRREEGGIRVACSAVVAQRGGVELVVGSQFPHCIARGFHMGFIDYVQWLPDYGVQFEIIDGQNIHKYSNRSFYPIINVSSCTCTYQILWNALLWKTECSRCRVATYERGPLNNIHLAALSYSFVARAAYNIWVRRARRRTHGKLLAAMSSGIRGRNLSGAFLPTFVQSTLSPCGLLDRQFSSS